MYLYRFADNTADGNQEGNGDIWGANFGYKTANHEGVKMSHRHREELTGSA